MKKMPLPTGDDLEHSISAVDWKEQPEEVLDSVDMILMDHGLEIVIYDSGDDSVVFSIEPLSKT